MDITIAEYNIPLYNQANVNLKYDSIASTFSFSLFFDPHDSTHREIFKPGAYHECIIRHNKVLLLTGICLSIRFSSAGDPPRQLVQISGYSKTGVLEDCPAANVNYQQSGYTITQWAHLLCAHYHIDVLTDPEVVDVCNTIIATGLPEPDEKIRAFLDRMCTHVNVVLSHLPDGRLLLTKVKSDKLLTKSNTLVSITPTPLDSSIEGAPSSTASKPEQKSDRATLCDLNQANKGTLWTDMQLSFNGQNIYSDIKIVGQQSLNIGEEDSNPSSSGINSNILFNPYYPNTEANAVNNAVMVNPTFRGQRPITEKQYTQTTNSDNQVEKTARSVLGDQIKNITLSISFDRWVIGGHVITPNQLITASNPYVYLYKQTKWFIQEVTLYGDEKEETAKIVCVPPDAFGTDPVVNIFK